MQGAQDFGGSRIGGFGRQWANCKYDPTYSDEETVRMMQQGLYSLDPVFISNISDGAACRPQVGVPGGPVNNHQFDAGTRTNVDSHLRGIDRVRTSSVEEERQRNPPIGSTYNPYSVPDCADRTTMGRDLLAPGYSRFTHPSSDIRVYEFDDMRLDYPLFDPQCNIMNNFSLDTRMYSKDNHRQKWSMPLTSTSAIEEAPFNRSSGSSGLGSFAKF
jgi:hypothetical protein